MQNMREELSTIEMKLCDKEKWDMEKNYRPLRGFSWALNKGGGVNPKSSIFGYGRPKIKVLKFIRIDLPTLLNTKACYYDDSNDKKHDREGLVHFLLVRGKAYLQRVR